MPEVNLPEKNLPEKNLEDDSSSGDLPESKRDKERIPIAKVVSVHGLKGEIKVHPYDSGDPFEWDSIFVGGREFHVERVRPSKGIRILLLRGINSREGAEGLVGLEVTLGREALPDLEEGEFYYFELPGMAVKDLRSGEAIGTVKRVLETGARDILSVEMEGGKEALLPIVKEIVKEVDRVERVITVEPLEGLLPEDKE